MKKVVFSLIIVLIALNSFCQLKGNTFKINFDSEIKDGVPVIFNVNVADVNSFMQNDSIKQGIGSFLHLICTEAYNNLYYNLENQNSLNSISDGTIKKDAAGDIQISFYYEATDKYGVLTKVQFFFIKRKNHK